MSGAICQTALMQGMRNALICDLRLEAAIRAYELNGSSDIVVAETVGAAQEAVWKGKPVVIQDATLVRDLELDCVVEGTGEPEVGAQVAYGCISSDKPIVMLNFETDAVIGPILAQLARRSGVVYTVSSGDEPGLITELVDRWGPRVRDRGSWKNPG